MNRRQFFKAAPAVLVSPVVPKPKPVDPLAGTIAVFNGKEYIKIESIANARRN